MTAPVQPQQPMQPQATQFAPRQFAGRRASGGGFSSTGSPQGDGSPQANGLSTMPQQQRPQPAWQTSHPPQASGSQGAQPTFAQMQANGQARPAPQQVSQQAAPQQVPGGVGSQLQSAVSNALSNPSRYDLPQVQQVQSALTAQLQQQFGAQQKQLDEEMARRGIGASSIASGYNGDLAGQQSTALANMDASLIQNAAQTNAQDLSASLGAGQAYQTGQQNYALGQGALGVQQQQANTAQQGVQNSYTLGQGQLGLGQQQLAQSGSQFEQNLGLQSQLGLGNLGVAQQQANTAQQGVQNQYALGQGSLGLQGQQIGNEYQLGLGNLGVSQQQVANQANQFGQTFGLSQLQNQQQYGLQTQAQQLAQTLGLGNLNLSQQQVNNQQNQFGQTFGLQQQAQNASQQQFAQSLAQALQLGTMSDTTANRGLDIQQQQGQNALLEELAMMGIGAPTSTSGGASGPSSTANTTTGTGNPDAFLSTPAGQSLMQTDPAMYGRMMLQLNGSNLAAGANTTTFNFNGQQYTPTQYYTLMEQHPELFQTQSPQQVANATNAPFFAQNAQQAAANQAAGRASYQQGQQTAQQQQQLTQAINQFQQTYGSGIMQPGSPGYYVPDPRFTDPTTGHMYSQAERDQASMQWSAAHSGG